MDLIAYLPLEYEGKIDRKDSSFLAANRIPSGTVRSMRPVDFNHFWSQNRVETCNGCVTSRWRLIA